MKGLNLSQFKKMKEDAKSATMIHKDGHQIIIAKAPLSHLQRKQLEAMETHQYAAGGKVGKMPRYAEGTGDAEPLENEPVQESVNLAPQEPAQQPVVQPMQQAQPMQQQQNFQNPLQAKMGGLRDEQAANLERARVDALHGQRETQAYDEVQKKIAAMPTQTDLVNQYREKNDQLFKAYQDQKINPNKYWEGHSKWGAALGMVLSGLGKGTGAMDVVQKGIERDIDAQKNDRESKMNLWKMNREMLGTDMQANLATQNQIYTGLKYQIDKAASQARGPEAMARAHAENAKIQQVIDLNNQKLALMNPSSDNPDPSTRVQVLVPQHLQKEAFEEQRQALIAVKNASNIMQSFDRASIDARPMTGGFSGTSGALLPGMHTSGQKDFAQAIAPTVQFNEGTINQQAFDNVKDNLMPRFGDSDETIRHKREAVLHYLQTKSAAPINKGFGIDLSRFPMTNTLAIGQTGPTAPPQPVKKATDYEEVKTPSGKSYMVPRK